MMSKNKYYYCQCSVSNKMYNYRNRECLVKEPVVRDVLKTADPAEYTDVPLSYDLTIRCSGLVPANIVDWRLISNDDGETWTEIDKEVNRMTYTIKQITAKNDGNRELIIETVFFVQRNLL